MTPVTAPVIRFDLERLAELRDRHKRLLEDYRRASAVVQEAAEALARLRLEAATHPAAGDVLRKPADQLERLTVEQLTELQINPRVVQQIKAAEGRLFKLTAARDGMQGAVAQSAKFSARLEAFAKARNL